jgi:ubiquitin-conjugating enzyme E2 J2
VMEGGREGRGWLSRNKYWVAGAVIFTYVLIARLLGEGSTEL